MKQNNPWPFPLTMPQEANQIYAKEINHKLSNMKKQFDAEENDKRADLLKNAEQMDIHLVHIYDVDYPKGGLTVAFKKTTPFNSGVMVECAVQTCSAKDSFSKKLGATGALEKFFDGQTIELPLLMNVTERDMPQTVKIAFTALYDSLL